LSIKEPSMRAKIEGDCDLTFARVRDAFAENFNKQGEVGAAVAVVVDGRPVVDLWGGYRDEKRTQPWTKDTLVNVYSTTKGLMAVCAHQLVSAGKLDLDAPVAKYWPEFAQAGKKDLPVRYLLSHRAGLPGVSKPLKDEDIYNWDTMASALAEQAPFWQPGTKHGYHAITIGWLVGEVIRRISGKGLGTYFRTEVAEPLGLDTHIGLDAKHDGRVTDILPAPPPEPGMPNLMEEAQKDPKGPTAAAFMNPPILTKPNVVNTRAWRGAEIGGANAHTTARSLARMYGALARGGEVDGYRIVRPESLERFWAEQSFGPDQTLMQMPTRFSMGFMLSQPGM